MKKKMLALFLVFSILFSLSLPAASLTLDKGSCGPQLAWALDPDGTLTITGTGPMDNPLFPDGFGWNIHAQKIKTVEIGSGVTSVGSHAFEGCSNLVSVTLPDTVTALGIAAFDGCSSLIAAELPPDLTVLPMAVFSGCTALTAITIPDGVTEISNLAFSGCTSLNTVTIPAGVTTIVNDAFQGCTALKRVFYTGTEAQWNRLGYSFAASVLMHYGAADVTYRLRSQNNGGCGYSPDGMYAPGTAIVLPYVFRADHRLEGWSDGQKLYRPDSVFYMPSHDCTLNASWDTVSGELDSGTFGPDLTWTLLQDGSLTVSGTGPMPDGQVPWHPYRDRVLSLTLGQGVTAIGAHNFYLHDRLTELHLPTSLTTIGDQAFSCCSNLLTTYCNEGLLHIGEGAFQLCEHLTWLTIPDSVTDIGTGAFSRCTSLRSVVLPSSLTTLSHSLFQDCTGLRYAAIPGCVTTVGSSFQGCTGLEEVTVPASVVHLNRDCFDGCTNLKKLIYRGTEAQWQALGLQLPESVTLQFHSPADGYDLTFNLAGGTGSVSNGVRDPGFKMRLPVPTRAGYTFGGWDDGTTVHPAGSFTMPAAHVRLTAVWIEGENILARGSCGKNLQWSLDRDGILLISGTGAMKANSDPWSRYQSQIKTLILEEGVTTVSRNAFRDCTGLTAVTLPETLQSIEAGSFIDCANLSGLTLPASLEALGEAAFYGCSRLTTVTVPAGVTTMGPSVFADCGNLTAIYTAASNASYTSRDGVLFTKNLKTLLQYPAGKSGSYTIPDGVTTLDVTSFYGAAKLQKLTIPASVTTIEFTAMDRCTGLTDVYYGGTREQWQSLGCSFDSPVTMHYASASDVVDRGTCGSSLTWTLSSEGVLQISGTGPMNDWKDLSTRPWASYADRITAVVLEDGVTTVGTSAFEDFVSLRSVTLPSSVTSLRDFAFVSCASLTAVTLPARLESIGRMCFHDTGLTAVTIPSSVSQILDIPFSYCNRLTAIRVSSANQHYTAKDGVLFTKDGRTLLQVPTGKTGSYQVPNGVITVKNYAMTGCSGLTRLTLPEGLTTIGKQAMGSCTSLQQISLPVSLTQISANALEDCPALTDVYYAGTPTQWKQLAFSLDPAVRLHYTGLYSLRFDLQHGTGAVPSGSYEAGAAIYLPTPERKGYRFRGWNDGTTTWPAGSYRMPAHDVTLTAVWEKEVSAKRFQLGRDNNSYLHADWNADCGFYGNDTYWIPNYLYKRLTAGATPGQISSIKKKMSSNWGGSCFGVSSSMLLTFEEHLQLSDLTTRSNVRSYFELPLPYKDPKLINSINYYQLAFSMVSGNYNSWTKRSGQERTLYDMIQTLQAGHPVVLCYHYTDWCHAILAVDCTQQRDGSYLIHLYDENFTRHPGDPCYFEDMWVSEDLTQFSFRIFTDEIVTERNYHDLYFFDADHLLQRKPYASPMAADQTMTLSFPLSVGYTLTADDGTTLTFDPGTQNISGSMPYELVSIYPNEEDSQMIITIPETAALHLTGCTRHVQLSAYTYDDFVSLEGIQVENATLIPGDSVTVNEGVNTRYTFEAALSTDELIDAQEYNLVSVYGQATAPAEVSYDRASSQVLATSSAPLQSTSVNAYVGCNVVNIAHTDLNSQSLTASTKPVAGPFALVRRVTEQDVTLRMNTTVPGTCIAALYDSRGQLLTSAIRELQAINDEIVLSWNGVTPAPGQTIRVFLLDQASQPLTDCITCPVEALLP